MGLAPSSGGGNALGKGWDVVVVCGGDATDCGVVCDELRERRRRGKLNKTCHIIGAPMREDSHKESSSDTDAAFSVAKGLVAATEFLRVKGSAKGVAPASTNQGRESRSESSSSASSAASTGDLSDMVASLKGFRVLLLTVGYSRHFWSPCLSSLPVLDQDDTLVSFMDYSLDSVSEERIGSAEPGVWVLSLDGLILGLPRLDSPRLIRQGPDAVVLLVQLAVREDVSGFFRAIYDPMSKQVEHLYPPRDEQAARDTDDEGGGGEENGSDDVSSKLPKVCGLVYLSFELCAEIVRLSGTKELCNVVRDVDLFDDILEVLSSNCSLDSYVHSRRSRIPQSARRAIFRALHPGELGPAEAEYAHEGEQDDALVGSAKRKTFKLYAADTPAVFYSAQTCEQYRVLQTSVACTVGDALEQLGYSGISDSLNTPRAGGQAPGSKSLAGDGEAPLSSRRTSFDSRGRSFDSRAGSVSSVGSSRSRIRTRSILNEAHVQVCPDAQTTNALLLGKGFAGSTALIENSKLSGSWNVHEGSALIGVRSRYRDLNVPPGIVIHERAQRGGGSVFIMYALSDDVSASWADGGTFMGLPWPQFCKRTGLLPSDLWPSNRAADGALPPPQRLLRNALLYPARGDSRMALDLALYYLLSVLAQLGVDRGSEAGRISSRHVPPSIHYLARSAFKRSTRLSLSQVEARTDLAAEVLWREQLSLRIDEFRIATILLEQLPKAESDELALPLLRRMAKKNHWHLLDTLDDIACGRSTRAGVAWAALACIGSALRQFAAVADANTVAHSVAESAPVELIADLRSPLESLQRVAGKGSPHPQAVRKLATTRRALLTKSGLSGPCAAELLLSLASHYHAATQPWAG